MSRRFVGYPLGRDHFCCIIHRCCPKTAEEFSFALAVVLTPAVIFKEMVRAFHNSAALSVSSIVFPSLLGMVFSFIAGLVALRWLAGWLEYDKWHLFGGYCLLLPASFFDRII